MEHRFAIVITGRNNEKVAEKCLLSALSQDYRDFDVFYCDDSSTDKTLELAERILEEAPSQCRDVTVSKNVRRQDELSNALKNIDRVVKTLDPRSIVVCLDGDDWYPHNNVLSRVAKEYDNDNVWLTYGNFSCVSGTNRSTCAKTPFDVIQNNNIRNHPWHTSPLRTFYAGLYHKIDKEDLKDRDGFFFGTAWDFALMFPMLEMAGERQSFISDVLYVYNDLNVVNDFKLRPVEQGSADQRIRAKKKYQPLPQDTKLW